MQSLMGYTDPNYALSLQEFGEPRELPSCGGWILVRPIPGTPYKDAMSCYPLFACRDWSKLHEDLECVSEDLVSLTLVTDPFSGISPAYLEKHFDLVKPFKTHYVVDLNLPLASSVSKHHRYYARKSLAAMDIEICLQPALYLRDWIRLYDNLISKHNITNINAFSRKCFEIQLNMPGMIMFVAKQEGEIIGAALVLIHDQVAYFHLSAFSDKGYSMRAAYGIRWKALVYGHEHGIRYFNHGGAAGLEDDPKDGLAEFKRGWSSERCIVFLCGRVFDRQKYESICSQYLIPNGDYFPAYRGSIRSYDSISMEI